MTRVAMIRCEKNEHRCPLTGCFNCLIENKEGFAGYNDCIPAGIFTCRCPGDNIVEFGKILKAKGADVIHFTTCTFSKKTDQGWDIRHGGFCDKVDEFVKNIQEATGIPCVKGTAHLPKGYKPELMK